MKLLALFLIVGTPASSNPIAALHAMPACATFRHSAACHCPQMLNNLTIPSGIMKNYNYITPPEHPMQEFRNK